MPVTHRINDAGIAQVLAGNGVRSDMARRGRRVASAARQIVGKDTGRLAANIGSETFTHGPSWGSRVGSDLDYSLAHHSGTGVWGPSGQPIRPKRGKFLVFVPKGQSKPVFARQVRGQQGTQYLRRALPAARD